MTDREKIDAAIDYLADRGVSVRSAAPFHYHFVWWLGLFVPPPHFQSFLGLLVFNGSLGCLLFSTMAFLAERHHSPVGLMLMAGGIGGPTIGLIMALLYRSRAWRLGLPSWDAFTTTESEEDADW